MAGQETVEPQWPLSFNMPTSIQGSDSPRLASAQFWSYELYRGPEKQHVMVYYSMNKATSEGIARRFSREKVLGFDIEWKPYQTNDGDHPLQHRVSLIQIACEDKIALFHIGQHQGKTPNDLIAPALKRIIESPTITKVGVGVRTAEYTRLKKYFALKPRSFFELSHLHTLVTYGTTDPEKCTTKLVSLTFLVEKYLGLPLEKTARVRIGRWENLLDVRQKKYAAADAYASFMLYHCMNAKRLAICPQPPLPICIEQYTDQDSKRHGTKILLRPIDTTVEAVTAADFFKPPVTIHLTSLKNLSSTKSTKPRLRKRKREEEAPPNMRKGKPTSR